MDLDAVKLLLDAHERAFRSAMDVVIDQLKGRIQITEGTITELIKSLEFSQAEINDLKNQVKVLQKADTEKQVEIDSLKSTMMELQQRVNYQEDYSRRNNLRISGIQEPSGGETWEQTSVSVSKLFEETLQLPSINLERAHRVGTITPSRPRTIVARFVNFGDREAVMRNARKLKGTGVYINDDLCPASQQVKRDQLPLLKQARQEGKVAYFKYTKLIIKDRMGQKSSHVSPGASSDASSTGGSELRGHSAGGETAMMLDGEPQSVRSPRESGAAAAWPRLPEPSLSVAVGTAGVPPPGSPGTSAGTDNVVMTGAPDGASRDRSLRKRNKK